jgi:hypothetical protein
MSGMHSFHLDSRAGFICSSRRPRCASRFKARSTYSLVRPLKYRIAAVAVSCVCFAVPAQWAPRGRSCPKVRMRTRLQAAMVSTNIRSIHLRPRTVTWRMLSTVFAQPKPCSINLHLRCEMAALRLCDRLRHRQCAAQGGLRYMRREASMMTATPLRERNHSSERHSIDDRQAFDLLSSGCGVEDEAVGTDRVGREGGERPLGPPRADHSGRAALSAA